MPLRKSDNQTRVLQRHMRFLSSDTKQWQGSRSLLLLLSLLLLHLQLLHLHAGAAGIAHLRMTLPWRPAQDISKLHDTDALSR